MALTTPSELGYNVVDTGEHDPLLSLFGGVLGGVQKGFEEKKATRAATTEHMRKVFLEDLKIEGDLVREREKSRGSLAVAQETTGGKIGAANVAGAARVTATSVTAGASRYAADRKYDAAKAKLLLDRSQSRENKLLISKGWSGLPNDFYADLEQYQKIVQETVDPKTGGVTRGVRNFTLAQDLSLQEQNRQRMQEVQLDTIELQNKNMEQREAMADWHNRIYDDTKNEDAVTGVLQQWAAGNKQAVTTLLAGNDPEVTEQVLNIIKTMGYGGEKGAALISTGTLSDDWFNDNFANIAAGLAGATTDSKTEAEAKMRLAGSTPIATKPDLSFRKLTETSIPVKQIGDDGVPEIGYWADKELNPELFNSTPGGKDLSSYSEAMRPDVHVLTSYFEFAAEKYRMSEEDVQDHLTIISSSERVELLMEFSKGYGEEYRQLPDWAAKRILDAYRRSHERRVE